MSYILDALKKAESERKMGGVPDLHAQPVSSLARAEQPAAVRRAVLAGAAVVALAAAIVLAWTKPWQGDGAGQGSSQAANTAPQAVAAAAPATVPPQPAAVAAPTPPAAVAAPASPSVATPVATAPAHQFSEGTPAPAAAGRQASEHRLTAKQTEPKPAKAAAATAETSVPPKQSVAAAPAAPAEPRIPEFSELPEAIRREIPAFTFGGYLYSSTPADRTVLVNNRLLREGDQIAPGLTLEKMMPKEAVLNYLGYRYRVSY